MKLANFTPQPIVFAVFLSVLTTAIIAAGLSGDNQGDVAWYQWMIRDWFSGARPYIEHTVEYPPYALAIFFLPWVLGDVNYLVNFMILALGLDVFIKFILLEIGQANQGRSRAYFPVVLYSLSTLFISYIYLQRFDLWPAALSLLAVWLFFRKNFLWSGITLAFGIGVKLYPLLFVLPLGIVAYRYAGRNDEDKKKTLKPFLYGLAIGLLPLVLLGFFLPWWNFAEFHGARGLQAESVYSSVLWMGKHLFGQLPIFLNLIWVHTTAWFEVQGELAALITPWAKITFALAVVGSTVVAGCAAWKHASPSISYLARILTLPLLAFVAFNPVLSPQYMIWLLPLAAVASLERKLWPMILIFLAVALTPFFYPVPSYFSREGLDLWPTVALFTRNFLLVVAWVMLLTELFFKPQHLKA